MDDALLDRLVALLDDSGLREIEFEEGDVRIHLVKDGKGVVRRPDAPAAPFSLEPTSPNDHTIVAGLTGTFYRSSSPEAPPFVEVGDRIEEGQTIGLLEAMKMLNPIEADRAGRIIAIAAADGALVTRGALLFRLTEADDPS